jgi:hypothetical protein
MKQLLIKLVPPLAALVSVTALSAADLTLTLERPGIAGRRQACETDFRVQVAGYGLKPNCQRHA